MLNIYIQSEEVKVVKTMFFENTEISILAGGGDNNILHIFIILSFNMYVKNYFAIFQFEL